MTGVLRLVFWLLVLLIGVALAVFAVTNGHAVTVRLWPLIELELPLWVVVLATLLVGFLVGMLAAWLVGGRWRRLARFRARRIDMLERDLAQAEARNPSAEMTAVARRP